MKITVINGTEKRGVTYRLKEMFLNNFKSCSETKEYYLPKDCPSFCAGCTSCFLKGENTCKDYAYVQAIEKSLLESDLIVITSPSYVMHATGALKALLDHFGYRWMAHRPSAEMFGKRAVVITQCLGAGAKSTAKDIKHSLSWWGVSKIGTFTGALVSEVVWDNLSPKKRKNLTNKINKLASKFIKIDYAQPARTNLIVKIKFALCRIIQKQVSKTGRGGLDVNYWKERGWLDKNRPWKKEIEEKGQTL